MHIEILTYRSISNSDIIIYIFFNKVSVERERELNLIKVSY